MASNLIPAKMVEFTNAMISNDWMKARQMQLELYDFFNILFVETNPGPVKYAAELMGLMNKRLRLPLSPPLEQNQAKIKAELSKLKLI